MRKQLGLVAQTTAISIIFVGWTAAAIAQGNSASKGGSKGRSTGQPATASSGAAAGDRVSDNAGDNAGDKGREILPASQPVFSSREITIITDWFRTNSANLPPGLAKREKLPPGLDRQLQKNGKLPPGLDKKAVALPIGLERQLRPIPTGYRRVVIGGNVITMEPLTGMIYDIIRGVVQ